MVSNFYLARKAAPNLDFHIARLKDLYVRSNHEQSDLSCGWILQG